MHSPSDYSNYQHVVVAVIENGRGEVLLSKRHAGQHQGGRWEFPGGKLEAGEGVTTALHRELREELAIEPLQAHPLIRIPYVYPEQKVLLDVWHVSTFTGEPHAVEGQPLAWVAKEALQRYEFPAANRPIITAAQLPSCYLITPEPGTEAAWPGFLHQLQLSLQAGVSLVQLRATTLGRDDYLTLAHHALRCCHDYGARLLLNADTSLLEQCDAAGVHLNSKSLMNTQHRPVASGKLLATSCHTLQELRQSERIGADFALLSPVRSTASHPAARPIGWQQFQQCSEQSRLPLYALGGMIAVDLPVAWEHGAQGIAAIRGLWGGVGRCDIT